MHDVTLSRYTDKVTTDPAVPLHRRLLDLAEQTVADSGPDAVGLRDVARRAGVSHAAPVHHFGSREGLLTELAAEGFEGLDAALAAAGDDLEELGVAYVGWGTANPGRYRVMWRPDLVDAADPRLAAARERAWSRLAPAGATGPRRADALAAFALVHGLVDLTLSGGLPAPDPDEPGLRAVLRRLVPVTADEGERG